MGDRRGRLVPLLALTALAAGALTGCGDDEGQDVIDAADGASIEGTASTIQLPNGRLSFEVSDAGAVDSADVADGEGEPDGEYVGAEWTWEPGAGIPPLLAGFLVSDQVPAEVRMRVDDTWHDLGPAYSTTESGALATARYIAAGEDVEAADVTIEVDFDGVAQTVRGDGSEADPGAAAPIYDLEETQPFECEAAVTPADVSGEPTCEAAVLELPYVTELGWADKGGSWVVVDLTTTLPEVTWKGDRLPVLELADSMTMDGTEPVSVLVDEPGAGGVLRTQNVFRAEEGAPHQVEFERQVELSSGAPDVAITGELDASAP